MEYRCISMYIDVFGQVVRSPDVKGALKLWDLAASIRPVQRLGSDGVVRISTPQHFHPSLAFKLPVGTGCAGLGPAH